MMRFFLLLTVLTVGLMSGFAGATVQLVVIIFLLSYQQFRKRDFYVVEHFLFDLNFIESPGTGTYDRPEVRIERGPMLEHACCREGFVDYAAAKASFDYREELFSGEPMRGTEALHRVYVVSASRKPANALLKNDDYQKVRTWLHVSPHQITQARRMEAREERLLMIESIRGIAELAERAAQPKAPGQRAPETA